MGDHAAHVKQWAALIDLHRSMTLSHLEFLTTIREDDFSNISDSELLQRCQAQAESLDKTLEDFQKAVRTMLNTATIKSNLASQQDQPTPSKSTSDPQIPISETSTANPAVDASGLFMTDTNPTPIEELLKINQSAAAIRTKAQPNGTSKRKGWETNTVPTNESLNGAIEHQEPSRKKARMDSEQKENHQPQNLQPSEEGDSFLQRVAAKVKGKEDRRKARLERKRKRESGGSTSDSVKKAKTKKKRQKKNNDGASGGVQGLNGAPSNGPRNDKKRANSGGDSQRSGPGQPNNGGGSKKKRKKST